MTLDKPWLCSKSLEILCDVCNADVLLESPLTSDLARAYLENYIDQQCIWKISRCECNGETLDAEETPKTTT